jgi:hypothetical protein
LATAPTTQPPGGFLKKRWESFLESVSGASNAEKVRAVLALTLVGVLISLQFAPSGDKALTTAAETLAISVVAFYFGLHAGAGSGRQLVADDLAEPPAAPAGTAQEPHAPDEPEGSTSSAD